MVPSYRNKFRFLTRTAAFWRALGSPAAPPLTSTFPHPNSLRSAALKERSSCPADHQEDNGKQRRPLLLFHAGKSTPAALRAAEGRSGSGAGRGGCAASLHCGPHATGLRAASVLQRPFCLVPLHHSVPQLLLPGTPGPELLRQGKRSQTGG